MESLIRTVSFGLQRMNGNRLHSLFQRFTQLRRSTGTIQLTFCGTSILEINQLNLPLSADISARISNAVRTQRVVWTNQSTSHSNHKCLRAVQNVLLIVTRLIQDVCQASPTSNQGRSMKLRLKIRYAAMCFYSRKDAEVDRRSKTTIHLPSIPSREG